MDLYLDPDSHDIIIENTNLRLVENSTEDPAETKQAAKVTFKTQQGEWLFDTDFGFPYLQEAFVRNPDIDALIARARIVASEVFEVDKVLNVVLEVDPITREMTGRIDLETDLGVTDIVF